MKGSYVSGRQRVQLANQGKKSNFSLGCTSHTYSTTQNRYFRSAFSKYNRQSNSRTESHFSLGSTVTKSRSEFSRNYKAHSVEPRKPAPLIKDLTPSSVVLGTQGMRFSTAYSRLKDPGSSKIQGFSNTPLRYRKSNFEMGFDKGVNSSIMQKDYQKTQREAPFDIEKNLLNSHVVMGSHPSNFKSSAKKSYFPKAGHPGKLPPDKLKDLKQEHFLLGEDSLAKVTTQNTSFVAKPHSKQGLPESKINYLKNSHFSFNSEQPDYRSVSKANMTYSPAECRTQERTLKLNHISLGSDRNKPISNYAGDHSYRSHSVNPPIRSKNEELNSDVVLGLTTQNMATTSNSLITGQAGIPGRMDPKYEKVLRYHHSSLGNSKNIYEQKHKNYGTGTPDPSQFLAGHKADLLKTHWTTGAEPVHATSVMKTTHKQVTAENRRPEEYLKKHNYVLGNSQNDWKSSYSSRFKWVQPVAEKNIRFSYN